MKIRGKRVHKVYVKRGKSGIEVRFLGAAQSGATYALDCVTLLPDGPKGASAASFELLDDELKAAVPDGV